RTDNYIFTADPLSASDMQQIDSVRKTVAVSNKLAARRAKWYNETPVVYRMRLTGRLGKGNPMAYKYRGRRKNILLADAQRIDVYVYALVSR
ncbi:MAG: hypothetical protein ACO3AG_08405, partial [Fluviibacter sp.]